MSTDNVNRRTESVLFNLYESLKPDIVPELDTYFTLHHTIYIYSGFLDIVSIRVGYYELPVKTNGSLFFCVNPNSIHFKHLYIYYDDVAYEYEMFNDYFTGPPQSSLGTGTGTMTPEIRQYIDSKVAAAEATAHSLDSVAPVMTLNDLMNITVLVDQRLIYVEAVNALYAYDLQSTAIINGSDVLRSATGIGRWIMLNRDIDGGVI